MVFLIPFSAAVDGQVPASHQCQPMGGEVEFHRLQQKIESTPDRPKPGPLAAEFEQLLAKHPDDPAYLYLYAKALTGKDTPKAIELLDRAAGIDAQMPWIYQQLASIYASLNFRDDSKVRVNIEAYRKLCPSNADGFRYLSKVNGQSETAALARQLRALLEQSKAPLRDAEYWKILWAAEFRSVSKEEEFPALRQRVAQDLRDHLEPLLRKESSARESRQLLWSLAEGYKLTGRVEDSARILRDLNPDGEMLKAYQEWEAKHGLRSNGLKRENYLRAFEDQRARSAEWVAQWPESRFAWLQRLNALSSDPASAPEQLEQAGDNVLRLSAKMDFGWTEAPDELRVAQAWVRKGVRLDRSIWIGQKVLDSLRLGPEERSDLIASKREAEVRNMRVYGYDSAIWDAMTVILEGQTKLRQFDTAHATLQQMRTWLTENVAKREDPTTGYNRREATYLYCSAEIAEAEGHALDSAALYARAVAAGWVGSLYRESYPREYWLAHGGSAEGWWAATEKLPSALVPAKPRPTARVTAAEPGIGSGWTKLERPIPPMNLQDRAGRTWTRSDFEGKSTFVTLWATWCGPCVEELPYIQKLYEQAKERPGVQVVTLNLDENPGKVGPFLAQHPFTFPVLMAKPYIDSMDPKERASVIPENWIVDRNAVIREQAVGFDSRNPSKAGDAVKQILEKLLAPRQ